MKKITASILLATALVSSASAELLTFEFDTMPYMSSGQTSTTGTSFTLGFKVNDKLRAGIMQENGNIQLTESGATTNGSYTASALNLEYAAVKGEYDAIIGLNIGSANLPAGVAATTNSSVAASTTALTDIYAKATYNADKHAYLNLKLGYRMLPSLTDSNAVGGTDFTDLNGAFLKLGVGVKF